MSHKHIDRSIQQHTELFIHSFVHSFIRSGYFYSASSSPPYTARILLCRNFTPQATLSKGLAQGPFVAVRAGVKSLKRHSIAYTLHRQLSNRVFRLPFMVWLLLLLVRRFLNWRGMAGRHPIGLLIDSFRRVSSLVQLVRLHLN